MEIKNLKRVANRIKKAIRNKERIILYGDADLDGVVSVIILKDSIKNLAGEVQAIYFPNREKEGYGITESALNFFKKEFPARPNFVPFRGSPKSKKVKRQNLGGRALLVTLDCGISNFEEVKLANSLGFEVVIIDHHEILDKLPEASIIVDPKQKGDKYPFKNLATAGIVYKLSQLLLKDDQPAATLQSQPTHPKKELTKKLKESFLELVALATLADMMPEEEDNKIMIEEGLSFLENSWRPGLKVFLKIATSQGKNSIREIAQKIISILNISETIDHLNQAFLFLTTKSDEEAERMAEELLEKSYQRQLRIREITKEVEEKVLKKLREPIVFEGDSSWPLVLIGSVASRICRLYQKPVFIYKRGELESRGAVRTPSGINGVELMKKCSQFLKTYGGHPPAAGFSIKNENLEKFKKCLIKNYAN